MSSDEHGLFSDEESYVDWSDSRGGGGGDFHIIEGMDVRQELSNPYPSQTKISANLWTLRSQMAEIF